MPKLSATLETIGEMPQRAESSDPTDLQNTGTFLVDLDAENIFMAA